MATRIGRLTEVIEESVLIDLNKIDCLTIESKAYSDSEPKIMYHLYAYLGGSGPITLWSDAHLTPVVAKYYEIKSQIESQELERDPTAP